MVCFCGLVGEIALLEGLTVVYKSNIDLFFYVIGSSHENEVSDFRDRFFFFPELIFYYIHCDVRCQVEIKKVKFLRNSLSTEEMYNVIINSLVIDLP